MRTDAAETVRFTVNGRTRAVETEGDRPLLEVLREDLGLTGAKYGCGEAQCGACSVLVEGERVFSCRTPISRVAGRSVVTIEGLAPEGELHPVQRAFLDEGAFQCGFCTAGMIVAAVALLEAEGSPSDAEIVEGMNRNLCRCCAYPSIVRAVRRACGEAGKS